MAVPAPQDWNPHVLGRSSPRVSHATHWRALSNLHRRSPWAAQRRHLLFGHGNRADNRSRKQTSDLLVCMAVLVIGPCHNQLSLLACRVYRPWRSQDTEGLAGCAGTARHEGTCQRQERQTSKKQSNKEKITSNTVELQGGPLVRGAASTLVNSLAFTLAIYLTL